MSSLLDFPIEQTTVTTYVDGDVPRAWVPTGAPVSNLQLSVYNSTTNAYDITLDNQYVHNLGEARVSLSQFKPGGADAIKATYTTGWAAETLPADLKQALIELVGTELLEVASYSSSTTTTDADGNITTAIPTGALKSVQSDSYSEEYSTAESDAY